MTLSLRYAAASDVGLLRQDNEDSAYAGPHLVAVADGMGGHAHGEVASATAIATLAMLDEEVPGSDLAEALRRTFESANRALHGMVEADASLEGMGTTLTALLYSAGRLCLAHVGDSRAYLLRGEGFAQVTKDHTLVQSLVDDGRLTEEQAAVHPQRSLLLRALGTGTRVDADVTLYEVRAGDRWLLCSDGLSGLVSDDTLHDELAAANDLDTVARRLVELANRAGGLDNITVVLADVVDSDTYPDHPIVVGAASETPVQRRLAGDSAASRAAALTSVHGASDIEDDEEEYVPADPRPRRRLWFLWPVAGVVLVAVLAFAGWRWTMSQYFIAAADDRVAIYRGLSQPVAGIQLNRLEQRTGIRLADLPAYERDRVAGAIEVGGRPAALRAVDRLGDEARRCVTRRNQPSPHPTASPSASRHPKGGADPSPSERNDASGQIGVGECPP